ncbi:MAG: VOC family protein [Alphaproteobacteria bacterium]|nr:VOC family protein [Alphaproteobacteria bacterium]
MDAPDFAVKFIDHLVLRTADADRLAAFYQDVVGLKLERRTESGLTQLRAGQCLLDIVPVDDRDQPGRNLEHFCFRIDPFDEAGIRRRLEDAGATIVKSGTGYGAEGRGPNIYFKDPDGNVVEFKGPSDGKLYTP